MPTIALQVSASNQDCLVAKNIFGNWNISLTHNQVSIGYHDPARYAQGAGLYFPNVPIPPGSTIIRAYLLFRASDPKALTPCKSIIEIEYNATPAVFSTLADYQGRTKSLIQVNWDFFASPWSKDKLYASPDISGHIQVAVDHPAWAEGNPIVLFWNDHNEESYPGPEHERQSYSWNANAAEAPRLEITFEPPTPPTPPPPWPLPMPPAPPRRGWCGTDLQYAYLDDGFQLTFHTDTPCHLWCRMTTIPPRKHVLPSMRRGLRFSGDIRFCFVVYEDNEQQEPGDTLIHTFVKDKWPICETRWFYFIGRVYGDLSPSESPIFEFHFPTKPSPPPPPLERTFIAQSNNRSLRYSHGVWANCHDNWMGNILPFHDAPWYQLSTETTLTASYFIIRTFLRFDTSSLPTTAKFVSARLYLYIKFALTTLAPFQDYLCITRGVQATPVFPTDYAAQLPYTTIGGQKPIASLTPGQYEFISFNLAGFPFLNPGGFTRLCLRHYLDIIDWAPGLSSNYAVNFSNQRGAGFQPYLWIQYNPA